MAAALSLALSAAAIAQQSPPGRTAQLSYIEGSVSLEPAGTQDWVAAERNRPMTVGDKLWADRDSRAELDIGDAVIRLWSVTGFSFLNLDQLTAQMQVTAGDVIVHVRSLADGEQDEIDTPNLALSLEQPGTYRVEVSESGDTTIVKVVSGEAVASGGGQSFTVSAQQSVTFTGTNALNADYAMLGAPDAFDDWSMRRDRQEEAAAAAVEQYVSPQVVGAQQLEDYGSWQYTPQWGYAWFPTVSAGWAPYSLGQWVWISPWGWTWVDDEPWGFAPFHYGRWGWWNGGWCWVPGPRRVRPIYAPALVAFTRSRIGTAGARPGVGWLPLGPRDAYIPAYAASRTYVRDINTTNTAAVDPRALDNIYTGRMGPQRYANSAVAGAVTVVPRSVFTTAQPVAPHRIALPQRGVTSARFTPVAPAVTPVKASVLGPGAGRAAPPRALIDRPVVARMAPSRAPVPFDVQRTAIRANGGRPLTLGQWAQLRPNRPAVPVRLAGAAVRESGSAARAAPALPRQSAFPRSNVPSNRPPWALGGSGHPPIRQQPGRAPQSFRPFPTPAGEANPPRAVSPPRFESAPRSQSPPHLESPPRSVPSAPANQPSHPPPEHAPRGRRPPSVRASFSTWGSEGAQWAAPPMYRAQTMPEGQPALQMTSGDAGNAYAPPATPPPMYRPVQGGDIASGVPQAAFAPRVAPSPPPAPRFAPRAPLFVAHPGRPAPRGVLRR